MKNRKLILIAVLLMATCYEVKAQLNNATMQKYVVFTFEVGHKGSKSKEIFYWITPQDSIERKNAFEVFPLYVEEYSKDILERCKKGERIDIFTSSTATNFNFDDDYRSQVENLLSIVRINKVKVQTFKKKWALEGGQLVVSVYASPVNGTFCKCLQSHGKLNFGFEGLAYLPFMSFSYDSNFWTSKNKRIVKYVDYSYIEYSSHYPSNAHGNSNIRVKGSIKVF